MVDQDREQVPDYVISRLSNEAPWVKVQTKTFTRWCNTFLSERLEKIDSLETDFADGVRLIHLLEEISGKQFPKYNKNPKIPYQKLENLQYCMKFLRDEGIKLVSIGAEDISAGNLKLILGLIWTVILRFQIQRGAAGSAKNALLEWVRKQIPEYDIQNFTSNWQDGKAIMALAESVEPGTFNLREEMTNDPIRNCELTFDRCEDQLNIPKVLDAYDMVNDPDEHSNMTYISYFRDYMENLRERKKRAEQEKIAIAAKCLVYGPGVENTQECYVPTEFTIEAINAFGTRVPVGGTPFRVDISTVVSGINVPSSMEDHHNGLYTVRYEPTHPGVHIISVTLDQKHCGRSPFRVNCNEAEVSQADTKIWGPGVGNEVEVGKPTEFYIQPHNRFGRALPVANLPFVLDLSNQYGPADSNLTSNGDGTYVGRYTPIDPILHTVRVTLNGKDVAASPYSVNATGWEEGRAHHGQSLLVGPGIRPSSRQSLQVDTAHRTWVAVLCRDAFGRPLAAHGQGVDVWVLNPNGDFLADVTLAPSHDEQIDDGKFGDGDELRQAQRYTFRPAVPGPHTVFAVLRHPLKPLYYHHVQNSPATIDVVAGVSAQYCYCYGEGVDGHPEDSRDTEFTIVSVDGQGQKRNEGGDEFVVTVHDPEGREVPIQQKDNQDGTYQVKYAPERPGLHRVSVSLRDAPTGALLPVKDSPYQVLVKAGLWSAQCALEQPTISFDLVARDRRGEPLPLAGSPFQLQITGPAGDVHPSGAVAEVAPGRFRVQFAAGQPGQYTVSAKLPNGESITGSPWRLTV